jgi:hypothetical protein
MAVTGRSAMAASQPGPASDQDGSRPLHREARLLGFLLLLIAIFVGARAAGSAVGPVTTSHAHVTYAGTSGTGSGMTMGTSGRPQTTPAGPPPKANRR